MKRTDLLLAVFLIMLGTGIFCFIEHLFRKTSESKNRAGKYIKIIEITNVLEKARRSD
jgi:hypothetical protein